MAYTSTPNYVADGEPVSAAVVNRVPTQLQANTDYLLGLINASTQSQATIQSSAPTSPSVLAGMAVFWNPSTLRYEPALAVAGQTDAVGVCSAKLSSTAGSVIVGGYAPSPIITDSGTTAPGWYYLSAINPGQFTQVVDPDLNIPVLIGDGAGNVWVNPQYRITPPNSVVQHGTVCAPSVAVGNPVYWNTANSRFEAALANVNNFVLGIVWHKPTSTTADVVLGGKVPLNFAPVIDGGGGAQAAQYFLSATTAGNVTTTVAAGLPLVPVFFADGIGGNIYVRPQLSYKPGFLLNSFSATSTDTYVSAFSVSNPAGLDGSGSVKNTGVNSLSVQESATDAYGVNGTLVTTVAGPGSLPLVFNAAKGNALPPFTTYSVSVKSNTAGQASAFTVKLTSNQ